MKTLACSADGKLIAVGNNDPSFVLQVGGGRRVVDGWQPSAKILDGQTGKDVATLSLETGDENALLSEADRIPHFTIEALAFSTDATLLAVGTSVGQVKLFNAQTGELIRNLDDEAARLADKSLPEKFQAIKRAMGNVESLAFSPDGSLLAACGGSFADSPLIHERLSRMGIRVTGPGRVKIWDVKTGALKHDLVGHSDASTVAFSADGNLLATAGRWIDYRAGSAGVITWNPHSGARLHAMTTQANGGVNSVALSPDSKLIAFSGRIFDKDADTSTTSLTLAHAGTGIAEWKQVIPGWAKPTAFSPDGKSIAVLCGGYSVRFYDVASGRQQQEIRPEDTPDGGLWNDFAIAHEAKTLVTGGTDNQKHGSVTVWSLDANASVESHSDNSPAEPKPDSAAEPSSC